jgi:ABC-type multidrug transport system fused ATPase/permease subunit
MFTIFSIPDDPTLQQQADHYGLLFVIIAIVAFITNGGSLGIFELVGERMTRRMRIASFKAILSQEMGFFDEESHGTGALTSRLATDASQTHDLIAQIFKTMTSLSATLIMGTALAFANGWQLALIILAIVPLLGFAHWGRMKVLWGISNKVYYLLNHALRAFVLLIDLDPIYSSSKTKKVYEESGQIAGEAISHIRTVASLTRETTFEEKYAGK